MHLMRDIFTFVIALLAMVTWAGAADIKVGIIGDQAGSNDLKGSYQALAAGVQALKGEQVDVVLHVGDMVESTKPPEVIRNDFWQAVAIMNGAARPWFLTPGDHDTNPPIFQQDSTDRSREQLFREMYQQVNPAAKQHFYYSFNMKNYHFVSLYSQEHLHTDPRWGNAFFAGISDKQLDWLKKDLSTMPADTRGVMVFIHQPLWYNWTAWERVDELLRQYPVIAVIAGHFHYNQIETPPSGITYLTVGATGATTKTADISVGGLQHVSEITVIGRHADFKILPLNDSRSVRFTPRAVMDRFQALDQSLDNGTYPFSIKNKIYQNHRGNLVNDCKDNNPAILKLQAVGNPIDRDVSFTFEPKCPDIKIEGGVFSKDVCRLDSANCMMPPGARIAVSNTSIVLANEYAEPDFIWQGAVKSPKAERIDAITMVGTFTMDSDAGLLHISKEFTVNVQQCQ